MKLSVTGTDQNIAIVQIDNCAGRQPFAVLAAKRSVCDGYTLLIKGGIDEKRRQFLAAVSSDGGQTALRDLAGGVAAGIIV